MRAAVGLAWRGAAMFAFGATAALAVTLNRPVPAPAALTVAARPQPARTCASAGLALSLGRDTGASGTTYHVDFTNTSGSACTLSGYPKVAAYAVGRYGTAQVGNAALRAVTGGASRVLLRPGGTAHWDVDISAVAPDVACRPVMAAGLRIVLPDASMPRYLRTRLTACSATGPDARVYLRVRAIQPGTGSTAPASTAPASTALRRHRHGGHGRVVA